MPRPSYWRTADACSPAHPVRAAAPRNALPADVEHAGAARQRSKIEDICMKVNAAYLLLVALAVVTPAFAQWEGYPTPGIPRTADGQVNLNAPLPRTPDGKPDLTGIWQVTRGAFNFA